METNKTYEVGQDVYLWRMGSFHSRYTAAKVVKVYPSGGIQVQVGTCEPQRFNANGKLVTGSGYNDPELDRIPFAERKIMLAAEQRRDVALTALEAVHGSSKGTWSRESLLAEVERLEALLDDARAKVEAI